MKITIEIIHAFSANNTGGCKIGIISNSDELTIQQKQHIAIAAAPLEIVYLSASAVADIKMEMYTGIQQFSYNERTLVAVAHYLKSNKKVTGEKIRIEVLNEIKTIDFKANVYYLHDHTPLTCMPGDNVFRLCRSLGICIPDIIPGLMPQVLKSGRFFLVLPIKDQNILRSITLDKVVAEILCKKYDLHGICLFSISLSPYTDAICRTFENTQNMHEQVSAISAAHVATFLYENNCLKRKHIIIEQEINDPVRTVSIVHINLNLIDTTIAYLSTGGKCYGGGTIEMEIENLRINKQIQYAIETFLDNDKKASLSF